MASLIPTEVDLVRRNGKTVEIQKEQKSDWKGRAITNLKTAAHIVGGVVAVAAAGALVVVAVYALVNFLALSIIPAIGIVLSAIALTLTTKLLYDYFKNQQKHTTEDLTRVPKYSTGANTFNHIYKGIPRDIIL